MELDTLLFKRCNKGIFYYHLLPPIATLGRKTGDSQRKSRGILIVFAEKH